MEKSSRGGLGFGVTSGVITTIGLIIGLYSSTHSRTSVLAGLMTVAVADSFSDAFGIHISEEYRQKSTKRSILSASVSAFLGKFITAASFVLPLVILSSLGTAVLVNILWSFIILTWISCTSAAKQRIPAFRELVEHLILFITVLGTSYMIGLLVDRWSL